MMSLRLWISSGIIITIVLIAFALSVPHTRDVAVDSVPLSEADPVPSVIVRDSFKNGVHTISGSVEALNACTSVSASATRTSDAARTDGILVAVVMSSDSEVCLQMPTRIDFKTTVSAPANLPISVTVNGYMASTTSL